MGIFDAVTSVVANVGSTLLQGYQNRKAAQKQNKYNYTAWQLQNEYNSPLNQRQRLEDAGYNPNLWYTNGNTGNAGTLATSGYQAADWQGMTNRVLNGLAQYQQIEAQKAGILNTEANTRNTGLQNAVLQHNLDYARQYNLPVGQTPTIQRSVSSVVDPVVQGVGKAGRSLWNYTTTGDFFEDLKKLGKSFKFENGNFKRARESRTR